MTYIQSLALTRKAKRVLKKVMPIEFVENSYITMVNGEKAPQVGNFILYEGKLSNKDIRKFLNIQPYLFKELRKTAKACGLKVQSFKLCCYLEKLISKEIIPGFNYLNV